MSHHSSNDDHKLRESLNATMKQVFGEYPDGKLNVDDAGGIALAVRVETGRVVVAFPKPVAWIGFTADQAMSLAELLIKNARLAGSAKPLTISLR